MIDITAIARFSSKLCSLEELSATKETTPRYVTHSQLMAFNFDEIKENYYRYLAQEQDFSLLLGRAIGKGDFPKSADALNLVNNKNVFFIEFKINKKNIKSHEIRQKALESLLAFMEITDTDRTFARRYVTYMVAYGEAEKSSREKIYTHHANKKANTPLIKFDLERYKGLYFKDVITVDNDDFDNYIKNEHWTSMELPTPTKKD